MDWIKNLGTCHTCQKPECKEEQVIEEVTQKDVSGSLIRVDTQDKLRTEESKTEVEPKADTGLIDINDFAKVKLIVGEIKQCEPVKGSSKLLKMQIDMGKLGTRQILAGVAKNFELQDLIGKQGVYVGNLSPRKMMGTESQGMMLFARDESGNMQMATVSGKVDNGTRLS